jgi:hypothetical protein
MARPGLKFDLLAAPKAPKPAREIHGNHACEVCGGRAPFGNGRRVIDAVWHCYAHWPDRPRAMERAA